MSMLLPAEEKVAENSLSGNHFCRFCQRFFGSAVRVCFGPVEEHVDLTVSYKGLHPSEDYLAATSVRSPRIVLLSFSFFISRIKVSKQTFTFILRKAALFGTRNTYDMV